MSASDSVTIPVLQQMKRDGAKSVGFVAWDYQIALIAERAGADFLVIGDSVSDQYTPSVAARHKDKCREQHAPWVGGGSANNVPTSVTTSSCWQSRVWSSSETPGRSWPHV